MDPKVDVSGITQTSKSPGHLRTTTQSTIAVFNVISQTNTQ